MPSSQLPLSARYAARQWGQLRSDQAELYRQKVVALEEALADPDDGAQAMEMIRALIDALVLTPEGGKLRIDLTGELAAILSIAQKDQRPRPEDEARAAQIKLVAGAGFTAVAALGVDARGA